MEDLNDKLTGGDLLASEWNQVPSELQNVIENLGIVLSSGDLNQLGKSIAGYVANGTFYIDSGGVNAYVLTQVGLKQSATVYTDGFQASFRVGATNTGASTVNVATLGVKSIFYNGSAVTGGELTAGLVVDLRFDNANDRFDLIPNLSNFIDTSGRFIITSATDEKLRLVSTNTNGDSRITFYQTSTERAYIEYADSLDDLQFVSKYGRISFWTDSAGTEVLRGNVNADGGLIWGSGLISLGVGTVHIENTLGINLTADANIPLHIRSGIDEILRIESAFADGDMFISFHQASTRRAFIEFFDTNDDLQFVSEFGRISFWNDSAGAEALSGYIDPDHGFVWGAPSGASQGAGAGNFENGVYEEGHKYGRMEHGSFTTALTGFGTFTDNTVSHGLGTDDLVILLTAKATSGSIRAWTITAKLASPNLSTIKWTGAKFTGSASTPATPSSGDIIFRVLNENSSGSHTFTVYWTVIARD